jgi:hypothetical protein
MFLAVVYQASSMQGRSSAQPRLYEATLVPLPIIALATTASVAASAATRRA